MTIIIEKIHNSFNARQANTDIIMAGRGDKLAIKRLVLREQECKKHISQCLKIKQDMYNVAISTIIIFEDGQIKTQYTWSDEQEKTLKLIDEVIDKVLERYGFQKST